MKQSSLVAEQFGATAEAYLSSAVHAEGADLARLSAFAAKYAQKYGKVHALDLGCGAGHTAFALASAKNTGDSGPGASIQVTACDLSPQMLAVVDAEGQRRKLTNLRTRQSAAEALPFADGEFNLVATRFSAHHGGDVPAALRGVRRVLKPGGTFIVIDGIAPEAPLLDTVLQSAEILRDPSHVRDYRVSEWHSMLRNARFDPEPIGSGDTWTLHLEFESWVTRMRTSTLRVGAIRDLLALAPEEARRHFKIQDDGSFDLDVAWIEAGSAA